MTRREATCQCCRRNDAPAGELRCVQRDGYLTAHTAEWDRLAARVAELEAALRPLYNCAEGIQVLPSVIEWERLREPLWDAIQDAATAYAKARAALAEPAQTEPSLSEWLAAAPPNPDGPAQEEQP